MFDRRTILLLGLLGGASCESDEHKLERLRLDEATECLSARALHNTVGGRDADRNDPGAAGSTSADDRCALARRKLNAFLAGR